MGSLDAASTLTELPDSLRAVVVGEDVGDVYQQAARRAVTHALSHRSAGQYGVVNGDPSQSKEQSFDLDFYASVLEHPDCRELSLEHCEKIGRLYESQEVDPDVFATLAAGNEADAERMLAKGGFIDQWDTSADVLERLQLVNPLYKPSGSEFAEFLKGNHERAAHFRAWGLFNQEGEIEAVASAFLPPHNAEKKKKHEEEVRTFFQGTHPTMHFSPSMRCRDEIDEYVKTAASTAEFYLIAARNRGGAATVVLEKMFESLSDLQSITDWYLLRFGQLDTVPLAGERKYQAPDADNAVSKGFFKRRDFSTRGECCFESVDVDGNKYDQVAGRQTREGSIVIVRPTWKVMCASAASFRESNESQSQYLKSRARDARRA